MSRIVVDPGALDATGGELAAVASGTGTLAAVAGTVGAGVDDPAMTAAALGEAEAEWAAGAERLQDELTRLADTARAAAFFYRQADERSMGGP
jgi:uncharacterized protein YukE